MKKIEIEDIKPFLTPEIIKSENLMYVYRDLYNYEDSYYINDAYFYISIKQKESYYIFDEIESKENILQQNLKNNTLIEYKHKKDELEKLNLFKEALIKRLKEGDRMEELYLRYAF